MLDVHVMQVDKILCKITENLIGTNVWQSSTFEILHMHLQSVISNHPHGCGFSYFCTSLALLRHDHSSCQFISALLLARTFSGKSSCNKWKFSGSNMRKDEHNLSLFGILCFVLVQCFSFPERDLRVLEVSHTLATQCYLPWLFSCLADMMFLPPSSAPHAIAF